MKMLLPIVALLATLGMLIGTNTIVIPGLNDHPKKAKKAKAKPVAPAQDSASATTDSTPASTPAPSLADAKPKTEETAKPKADTPAVKPDPAKGAAEVATIWSEMDDASIVAIVAKWNDDELAPVLLKLDPEKASSILKGLKPDRASALLKKVRALASAPAS